MSAAFQSDPIGHHVLHPVNVPKARLDELVDAILLTMATGTTLVHGKTFNLHSSNRTALLCIFYLPNRRTYHLVDKMNTTAEERRALIPLLTSRLVAGGFEFDPTIEVGMPERIDVNLHDDSPSIREFVAKMDLVRPKVTGRETAAGGSGSSSSSSSYATVIAINDVHVRLQQFADTVVRTVMAIPKFQAKSTRFNLTEAHNGVDGVEIVTADGGRYFVGSTAIRDRAECKTVIEIATSRLMADGFKLDRSLSSSISSTVSTTQLLVETKTTPPITDHASFFRALCLTDHQIECVRYDMPIGAHTDDLFWLSCFDTDMLRENHLSPLQRAAWHKLIAKLCA